MLADTLITKPLFPNLRDLESDWGPETRHLSHIPFPSLTQVFIRPDELDGFKDMLESFAKFSPNLKRLHIEATYITFQIGLDIDALVHLSHMPALSNLAFTLDPTLPALDSPLLFSNLHHLALRSQGLHLISKFLSHSQLPAIISFKVSIGSCPSRQELSSFLSGILMSGAGQTIEELALDGSSGEDGEDDEDDRDFLRSETLMLGMEDLEPCLAFSNLNVFQLEIGWKVDLKDSGLLALASSWPGLKVFEINKYHFGWHTQDGITPDGLLQLAQRCPSLSSISVALDTRGYIALPTSGLLQLTNLTSERPILIDVIESKIEAESVPAIAAFFAGTPRSTVDLGSNCGQYRDRWNDVRELMGLPKLHYCRC